MFSPGVEKGPPALAPFNPAASSGSGNERMRRRHLAYAADAPLTIDLRGDHDTVAAKLLEVTRLRDPNLADHAQRTAQIAVAVGSELGLDRVTLDHVYLGAQLHDVGKLGVAEAILWKPAGLTTSEWREVRTHPEEGHRLVADVVHRDVAAAVLYHHERIDGDGYPFGIDGRTLSIVVRVVQVADAFDAMTSDRPYQGSLSSRVAVSEIARCAGTQFDPEVADAIAAVFDGREERFPPIERTQVFDENEAERAINASNASDPFVIDLTDRPA